MFDNTNIDDLYGDPDAAHNAAITALACKALGQICTTVKTGARQEQLTRSAACKADRIVQRSRMARA